MAQSTVDNSVALTKLAELGISILYDAWRLSLMNDKADKTIRLDTRTFGRVKLSLGRGECENYYMSIGEPVALLVSLESGGEEGPWHEFRFLFNDASAFEVTACA
jgi:hypothetical protein